MSEKAVEQELPPIDKVNLLNYYDNMNSKRVYVTLFESKISDETFIKVGVSSKPIDLRFSSDLKNYKITLLRETKYYNASDSFIVESNFHNMLEVFKYYPTIRLSSGNTECFINSNECLRRINNILDIKHSNRSNYIKSNSVYYKEFVEELRAIKYGKAYIKPVHISSTVENIIFTDKIIEDMTAAIEENKRRDNENKKRLENISKNEKIQKRRTRRLLRKEKRLEIKLNSVIPPMANTKKWTEYYHIERARLRKIEKESSDIFNGFIFLDDTRCEIMISKKYRKEYRMKQNKKIKINVSPIISGKRYNRQRF